MRRHLLHCTLVLLLATTLSPAMADDASELPEFAESIHVVDAMPFAFPVDSGARVTVRFGIGELAIVAADIDEVRGELDVDCKKLSESRCRSYRDRLHLEAKRTDGGTEVALRGLSKWKLRKLGLEGNITVPRDSPLTAEIGIGDVEIRAGSEDLAVRMGIGDLTVHVPARTLGSVAMATRIGDASLAGALDRIGSRRRLLGASVDWTSGFGEAKVQVGLKIGDARVVLE